jgi:hypothetical protein
MAGNDIEFPLPLVCQEDWQHAPLRTLLTMVITLVNRPDYSWADDCKGEWRIRLSNGKGYGVVKPGPIAPVIIHTLQRRETTNISITNISKGPSYRIPQASKTPPKRTFGPQYEGSEMA